LNGNCESIYTTMAMITMKSGVLMKINYNET